MERGSEDRHVLGDSWIPAVEGTSLSVHLCLRSEQNSYPDAVLVFTVGFFRSSRLSFSPSLSLSHQFLLPALLILV